MVRRRINQDIQQRGFVWQCTSDLQDKKWRPAREGDSVPCGHWNPYFGRKWYRESKRDPRWDGRCKNCNRKRQLNLGKVLPENGQWLETKEEAVAMAQDLNEQREHKLAIEANHREPEAVL